MEDLSNEIVVKASGGLLGRNCHVLDDNITVTHTNETVLDAIWRLSEYEEEGEIKLNCAERNREGQSLIFINVCKISYLWIFANQMGIPWLNDLIIENEEIRNLWIDSISM